MNSNKSLGFLSDVTFDLVLKELRQDIPQDIRFNKYEDIVSALSLQQQELNTVDYLFLHCETIFNKYSDAHIADILSAIERFALQFGGTLILSGFSSYNRHYDLSLPPHVYPATLPSASNILFADYGSLVSNEGLKQVYHYPLGHLYQMPYTKSFIKVWGAYLKEYFLFLARPEKKVIVLDCDNTLWGGILGEDGADQVKVNRNADGILFLHLQQWLKERQEEGFLLCLCSKNNEADVKEMFDRNVMPLRWDDFIVKKVNWEDKYSNLTSLAAELNVGAESFIFIDDNAFEIESVQTLLPEVTCFLFKNDYDSFQEMSRSFFFKRKRVLKEDREKQQRYKEEQAREDLKNNSSFDDYVRSLQIVTEYQIDDETQLERYAQMTEKTNQFNFNKIVYTPAALKQFLENGNGIFGLKVADRFGNYGVVGLILVKRNTGDTFSLHNFLMSCRVLGRGVEDEFFRFVLQKMEAEGRRLKEVEFMETAKNKPAKTFYDKIAI